MKAIKKPVPVEVWQIPDNVDEAWTYKLPDDIFYKVGVSTVYSTGASNGSKIVSVESLEGEMTAHPGDYIVQGSHDDVWVVQKDIFEDTYEVVEDDPN
ncbi:hypothetical protein [Weissella viridescens]|uniref:hypothetical protein n=1 Tax=Weissella viridescens TaxID=1629 RepID=UPI003AF301C4